MPPIHKVLFLGSKRLGLRCVKTLHALAPGTLLGAITIDDRSDRRTTHPEFAQFCRESRIPFHTVPDRRSCEHLVTSLQPDLCFVCGWYWLIGSETLNRVPHGFVGIHYSLLPKYRGSSPLVWALINGDTQVGMSMFSLTSAVDDGDLWAQERVEVNLEDTIGSVLDRLERVTLDTLQTKYLDILSGRIKPVPQNLDGSTFCAQRLPSDGEIQWGRPARNVYNFIRAQTDPYPGSFTWLDGERLVIWGAQLDETVYYGRPGQVVRVNSAGALVVCGDNRPILLTMVEWQGRRAPASEVVRSVRVRLGR